MNKNTHQPKVLENPNIIDIKAVTIKHPKSSCKLSKTIRQLKKFPKLMVLAKFLLIFYIVKGQNVEIYLMKIMLQKSKNNETISCL